MQRSEGPNQSTIDEEVERLKLNCQHELNQMRVAALTPNIHEMEERARRIVDLTRKPKMPVDLGRTAMSEMKELELLGYQKATDHAIRKAMSYGLESKNAEKIRAITTARHFLSKSMARGASEEFKKPTEMTLDSAELTGKQQSYGPTRANPGAA